MKRKGPATKKHPGWKHVRKANPEDVRSTIVTLRFAPAEKAALEFVATSRGESLTEFFRAAILGAARKYIDAEKASLGAHSDVVPATIRNASDQYTHRKASPVAPLQEDRFDPVLLDIYRSVQAIGGTIREIYLTLKTGPGYDPCDPVSVEKFDCMASVFSDLQSSIEEYLGTESAGEVRIIPPSSSGKHRTETAAFRAAMMEPDEDSLEDY